MAVALLVGVLAASGCAAQDAEEPKTSTPAGARSLDQHQLETARLTRAEATDYVHGLGAETPKDMTGAETDATPEACVPAITVLRRGWGEGAVGYSVLNLGDRDGGATTRSVKLTTYPAGRAEKVLASVEASLRKCPSVVFRAGTGGGPVEARLTVEDHAAPGEEALRATMVHTRDGIENHVVYEIVRAADVLCFFSATGGFGSTLSKEKKAEFMPVLKDELISRQVAKVEAALKAAS
ncbi:hypothetical protein ACH4Y0_20210 [Streptomyces sp. NPDC020707]|uniref:hypothetical protein n=1 Tax=Streptomyces sp. NPDC020707 TaxID=3365084 RepID=UPI0037A02551